MSYLVLARKWRPRRFAELVGQEHVVRALGNALESGRVHHAFLFTGTRGVGKTTIARIFAKSLNCESGVSADPCGQCAVCSAVDAGRFVDLLEIDAASNTGVDDVREVIENAQYLPTRGRYKVYLIDEVHMLSKNAFNALLKTLEEPPEHVKFLLATTDPQKLPVTVLSRCLQFNLKRLTEEQIAGQMQAILNAEEIAAEASAIALLARAADGSLRDGLSLLDQAIAFGAGRVNETEVRAMLGTVDRHQVTVLLQALVKGDAMALRAGVETLAGFGPDFGAALDAIAELLHRVQLRQLLPAGTVQDDQPALDEIAQRSAPEAVQLWYQMALNGRRDLPYAPAPRIGFEMTLLRMLAFQPANPGREANVPNRDTAAASRIADAKSARSSPSQDISQTITQPAAAAPMAVPPLSTLAYSNERAPRPALSVSDSAKPPILLRDGNGWIAAIESANLRGPVRELAANAAFAGYDGVTLTLTMPPALQHLRLETLVRQLAQALTPLLGTEPRLRIADAEVAAGETLQDRQTEARRSRQAQAEAEFMTDPGVRHMIGRYGARPIAHSIRPVDEA